MNRLPVFIALIIILLFPFFGLSQNGSFTGMGNSSVMLYDFWALNNNQAGIADIDKPQVGVCYDFNYQLGQTGVQTIGFVLPTKSGNFAFSGSRYGYSGFSENNTRLAYARNIGKIVSASVQFDYLFYNQEVYGLKGGALVAQIGIISQPIENLQVGVHIYNPSEVVLEQFDEALVPTILRFGLGYYFSKQVVFTTETEINIEQKNRFKAGLQYEIIENFFIRTGFLTNPNQFSLGIGYNLKKLSTDFAITTHETLQLSTQISFKYSF